MEKDFLRWTGRKDEEYKWCTSLGRELIAANTGRVKNSLNTYG